MTFSIDLVSLAEFHFHPGIRPIELRAILGNRISLRTARRWIATLKKSGKLVRKRHSGRPKTVTTKKNISKVRNMIGRVGGCRKVAERIGISSTAVHYITSRHLGHRYYICKKSFDLSDDQKWKRKNFSNWALKHFGVRDLKTIMYSDEKLFLSVAKTNRRNSGVYARTRQAALASGGRQKWRKYPGSIMVWLGITWGGLTEPIFFAPKERLAAATYIDKVLPVVKREGRRLCGRQWVYQQDGAPAHRAQSTQKWCASHLPGFIPKDFWPPNSPDLNPLDYAVWDQVSRNRLNPSATTYEELKKDVEQAIQRVPKSFCQRVIRQWLPRVRHCYRRSGDYIDDKFE
jgi:transposase